MFHVFLFFFLFVSSFQLNFNLFNYQPWHRILPVTMCCVVMTPVFSWCLTMKGWLGCACICRFVCVCVHFLHRCQYCHTRFNALVRLHINMYFISHRHNGVLSFWLHIPNSCSQNVSTSCARCLFMHCSIFGWLLRQRCAQRLCKGLPT